jgi:MscS family membrane protein
MNLIDTIPYLRDLSPEMQFTFLVLLAPLLILLASWFLRFLLMRIVLAPVQRFVSGTATTVDDKAFEILERPIRIFVLGLAILIISTIFNFTGDIDAIAENIARALFLVGILFFVVQLVDVVGISSTSLNRLTGLQVEERLLPFLRVVVKLLIIVVGLLAVVQVFGYDGSGLIASFGIIGLAFSLAAQDTAANIFGFTAIVSDNPFHVGDTIQSGDITGTVEKVGVRSTRIRKTDQALVTVPNSKLSGTPLINLSRMSKRRLDFTFGLTYDTKSEQMQRFLEAVREMLSSRELIEQKSIVVRFMEFGGDSLRVRVMAFILLTDWAEFTEEQELVNIEIMRIVEAMGLELHESSTSITLHNPSEA